MKELYQFYTNPLVADECVKIIDQFLTKLGYEGAITFLEPSAGTGNFVRSLKKYYKNNSKISIKRIIAVDIDPKDKSIEKMDYLKSSKKSLKLGDNEEVVVFGNPPFGKRSKMALEFINYSYDYADTIAFIVPLHFQKWSAQSKVNKDLKLVFSKTLDEKSFTYKDKDYSVRCCFQIWTKKNIKGIPDLRLKRVPITKHKDFEMFQYNNTKAALKYFNKEVYKWDFAVPRQGFYDYNKKVTDEKDLNPKIQWIFFKAKDKTILERLKKIDYEKISLKNTSIPGFGKADVIEEYNRLYGDD
jgi:predicted RNA methylase